MIGEGSDRVVGFQKGFRLFRKDLRNVNTVNRFHKCLKGFRKGLNIVERFK